MNARRLDHHHAVRVADLLAEGERMPVYVHVIDHPTRACWSIPA